MPKEYFPATILIDIPARVEIIAEQMNAAGITFPVIAKPDRGERGWCVRKVNSSNELIEYTKIVQVPFLIQAYVAYPMEFSIFYYRSPKSKKGKITSVTFKKIY